MTEAPLTGDRLGPRARFRAALPLAACFVALAWIAPSGAAAFEAPDPGGSETENVAIPPAGPYAGKYFGLNDDFIDYAHHQSPASYANYSSMVGSNTVKMSLEWWRAERFQADQWVDRRWQVWQVAYDAVRAEGMTPLFILSSAPCWARVDPCSPGDAAELQRYPPTPANDAEWAEFVAEVATRFPNSIIQVWNEVNLTFWWRGSAAPQPARYTEILKRAHDAVQQVELNTGVNTPVIGPALANLQAECGDGGDNDADGQSDFPNDSGCTSVTDDSEGPVALDPHMPMAEFLKLAYEAPNSLDDYSDALALNIFAHSNQYGANTLFSESFQQARAERTAAGDTSPIYITETGLGAGFFPTNKEANRGFALLRLYRRLVTMPDVGMAIFHRIIEPKDINFNPLETDYGWLKYSPAPETQDPQTQAAGLPQPKYVYCLFSQLAYLSSGANEAGRDADIFYPPCGAVIAGSTANANNSWTFTFGTPNYPSFDHLECSVDGGTFATCTSPHTTAPLSPGTHTFAVRAVDPGGQPTPAATRTFPDNVAPVAQFDAGPAPGSTTTDSTPTFEFSANEPGSTFECSLNGGQAIPCTSPWARKQEAFLPDRSHTLAVTAIDLAGNRSVPVQRTFTVEAAVPAVQITSGPANGSATKNRSPSFEFLANEPATYKCSVDGGTSVSCSSPFIPPTPLGDGSHAFSVVATDMAGKQSPAAQRVFTVDATGPTVTIQSHPNAETSDATPTFGFSAEPGSTFQCTLDAAAAFGPCSGPGASHTTQRLSDGFHYVGVRAVDALGNVGNAAYFAFVVEQPQTELTSTRIRSRLRTAVFSFTGTSAADPVSFECRLDTQSYKPCTSPKKVARLKNGTHTFQVRTVDAAGVKDTSPAKKSFKISG